jgi:uncharacterized membrane protein
MAERITSCLGVVLLLLSLFPFSMVFHEHIIEMVMVEFMVGTMIAAGGVSLLASSFVK